jgi:phosphoenolpyruvate synthase/pyruvate phosphate dikinase
MQPVLAFDQIHAGMLAIVGGKAGNLGEMSRAGLPVPPGFCVTTEAYRRATSDDGLRRILEDIAATAPADTVALSAHAARADRDSGDDDAAGSRGRSVRCVSRTGGCTARRRAIVGDC